MDTSLTFVLCLFLSRTSEQDRISSLEQESVVVKDRLAEVIRNLSDSESRLTKKDGDLSRLQAEVVIAKNERRELEDVNAQLDVKLQSHARDLASQRELADREVQARASLEKELDELRRAMGNEETRRSEVERSKDQEISSLRAEVAKLESGLSQASRTASEATDRITLELESARRQLDQLSKLHDELKQSANAQALRLSETENVLSETENARHAVEAELQSVRSRLIDADAALTETRKAKEVSG